MKKILLLQIRPEVIAADNEFEAFVRFSGLQAENFHRIDLTKDPKFKDIKLNNFSAVIVGGGPACISTKEEDKPEYQQAFEPELLNLMGQILEDDFPFLGACYGIGLLAQALCLKVSKDKFSEPVGAVDIKLKPEYINDDLLEGLSQNFDAFVGHKEAVQQVDDQVQVLASSLACPFQMLKFKQNVYATQFHPELDVEGIITRIKVYKNAGYFPPENADQLIEQCRQADVHQPVIILKNFCQKYST